MTENIEYPRKTREIKLDLLDSSRWNDFVHREDDIVIASYGKGGTTWVQQIVAQLVFEGAETPVGDLSPWLDFVMFPRDEVFAELAAQTHRRFIKTHLPVDALGIRPELKYIYVSRDARDVIFSAHKFALTIDEGRSRLPPEAAAAMPAIPPTDADPRTFFNEFLDDGFVIGLAMPFFAHVQGWWNVRELPNVLLVHFANLKADMPREIRRIAEFLDIQPGSAAWPKILEHCSFDYMKRNADSIAPKGMRRIEGGTSNFFHKGTNGRWRDVLTPADLSRFAQTVAEKLTPDCARWLETGVMPG